MKSHGKQLGRSVNWVDALSLVFSLLSLTLSVATVCLVTIPFNTRTLDLQRVSTELSQRLTDLQANITELTENQTKLQQRIFELENWPPAIEVTEIQPIVIGPSQNITQLTDGRVSFEYNGTLTFTFTMLAASSHTGKLMIYGSSFQFHGYNQSQLQIHFALSGITAPDYNHLLTANRPEEITATIPFTIYYTFSESHILEYPTCHIGYIQYQLAFIDYQSSAITYAQLLQTNFLWNNQTSLS